MAQGRIQYEITAKDRSAAALNKLKGNLGGVSTAVGSLTRLLAPLAVAFSAGALGSNLVRTNREFQSLKASLTTFTGSVESADRAFNILRTFASETPFAVNDVVQSFNILVSRGIAPTVGELEAFGDIAAGSGKSFQQLAEAIADAAVGEFERLKEFGIKARKENEDITFSIGNTALKVKNSSDEIVEALTEIAKVQFGGATARQAATLNGAFSNLGDVIDNLFFSIGEAGLNKEIVRVTRSITEAIGESDSLARKISGVLVKAIKVGERAFEFLADSIDEIIAGFAIIFGVKIIRNIASTISAIVNFSKAIAAAATTTTLFKTVSSLLTKNLGLTIGVLGTAAAGTIAFKDEIGDLIKGITDQINVSKVIDSVLDALGFTIEDTASETAALADEIETLNSETELVIKSTNDLTAAERRLLDQLQSLQPAASSLGNDLQTLDDLFLKQAVSIGELSGFTQDLVLEYTGLKNNTKDARIEQERLEEAIQAVVAAGGDNSETLGILNRRLIDLRAQTEDTYGAGAIKGVKDYYDSISSNSANAARAVETAFGALEQDLSQFFQTGKLSFDTFKQAIVKGLADIAAKAVVTTGINFLGDLFPSLDLAGFKDGGLVQGYANGGFVSGPGGPRDDKILAKLSDGEFVMNARAVQTFGSDFFNALNTGTLPGKTTIPEDIFGGAPGFFLGGIISGIGDVIGGIADTIGGVINSVVDAVGDVVGAVTGTVRRMIRGILEGDLGTILSVASAFVVPGVGSGIFEAFKGATSFTGFLDGAGSAISNSFANGIFGAGATQEVAKSIAIELAKDTVTSGIATSITNQLLPALGLMDSGRDQFNETRAAAFAQLVNGASPYLERRQMGGPLGAGQASLVGEDGPEVFIPNRNGTVAPISRRGSDLVGAVDEMKDEIVALRRQLSRAISGGQLAGARG